MSRRTTAARPTTPRCSTGRCPRATRRPTARRCTSWAMTCTGSCSRARPRAPTGWRPPAGGAPSGRRGRATSARGRRSPLSPERTILAMGGGGFSMEPDNPALDDYVLSLTDAPEPRVCLLPTASGDGEGQIRQFPAPFGARACDPTHIALFRLGRRPVPLRETLLRQHIV